MRAALTCSILCIGLVACGSSEKDSAGPTGPSFDNEMVLQDDAITDGGGECSVGYYFPATTTHMPMAVARFDAPEPPYEIRELSVLEYQFGTGMWGGNDCSSKVELELFAVVHGGKKLAGFDAADDASLPEMNPVASGTVKGNGGAEGETELLTVTIDPPVLVEEPGYLWVGYRTVREGAEGACPVGCVEETQPGAQYMLAGNHFGSTESGWAEIAAIPDVRATVGY